MNPRKGLNLLSVAALLLLGACAGTPDSTTESTTPAASDSEPAPDPAPTPATTEPATSMDNWPTCTDIAAAVPEFITADFTEDDRGLPAKLQENEFACAWAAFTGEPGDSPNGSNTSTRWVYLMKTDGLVNADIYQNLLQ